MKLFNWLRYRKLRDNSFSDDARAKIGRSKHETMRKVRKVGDVPRKYLCAFTWESRFRRLRQEFYNAKYSR